MPAIAIDENTRIDHLEGTVYGGPNPTGGAAVIAGTFTGNVVQVPAVLSGSANAITFPGQFVVTSAGVNAMTLATPTSGTDDGKIVRVMSSTANAHTITTAQNKIVSGAAAAGDTLTFAAKVGANVTLEAYGGLWYIVAVNNVVLTEV